VADKFGSSRGIRTYGPLVNGWIEAAVRASCPSSVTDRVGVGDQPFTPAYRLQAPTSAMGRTVKLTSR
jgi:hypothetical protein